MASFLVETLEGLLLYFYGIYKGKEVLLEANTVSKLLKFEQLL